MDEQQNIIIYRTADGRASVALYAKDGKIWLNQQQMAELFATSKPNISMHISNILKEKELYADSVVKDFLTTAADAVTILVASCLTDESQTRLLASMHVRQIYVTSTITANEGAKRKFVNKIRTILKLC